MCNQSAQPYKRQWVKKAQLCHFSLRSDHCKNFFNQLHFSFSLENGYKNSDKKISSPFFKILQEKGVDVKTNIAPMIYWLLHVPSPVVEVFYNDWDIPLHKGGVGSGGVNVSRISMFISVYIHECLFFFILKDAALFFDKESHILLLISSGQLGHSFSFSVRRTSSINVFSSETTGPIFIKFGM